MRFPSNIFVDVLVLELVLICSFFLAPAALVESVVNIPQKTATMIMSVLSVIVLFLLLKQVFWWTVFSSGFLILAHAASRDASLHKDSEDQVDMHGDLTLPAGGSNEEAAFLNAPVSPPPVEGI